MFEPFHEVVNNVSQTILKHEKELDRPVIGVMPAYFPMELIEAAGGYPVQLWGNNLPIEKADAYLQSYCCSVARSVMELELREISHMVRRTHLLHFATPDQSARNLSSGVQQTDVGAIDPHYADRGSPAQLSCKRC